MSLREGKPRRARPNLVLVAAGFVATLTAGAWTPAPARDLPAPSPARVGRAQIFEAHVADKSLMAGHRDFIWDGTVAVPGAYVTNYLAVDRDLDRAHGLAWLRSSHPDWIVYNCAGEPVREYGDIYVTIDVSNPAVQEYIYAQGVAAAGKKGIFNAIGIDNINSQNVFNECVVEQAGVRRQIYSGARVDRSFADARAEWLTLLAARAHAAGLAVAGNLAYSSADRAGFFRLAGLLDVVLDEGGFQRNCRPSQTDDRWRDRIAVYERVARERPLVAIEKVCPTLGEMTPVVREWSFANYLLIKQDRTYLTLVPERQGYEYYIDFPEYYMNIGRPAGAMGERGGVYFRQFEHAVAAVNPSSSAAAHFVLPAGEWRDEATGDVAPRVVILPPASAGVYLRTAA